jgi:hypothetical protein
VGAHYGNVTRLTTQSALVVLLLVLTGCTTSSPVSAPPRPSRPTQTGAGWHTFTSTDVHLTFEYPRGWNVQTSEDATGSFSFLIAYVSNQPLHKPCRKGVAANGYSTQIQCGRGIRRLRRGGVHLAWWGRSALPGAPIHASGRSVTVAGRIARFQWTTQRCGHIGADRGFVVTIPRDSHSWYEFDACMRGPHLSGLKRRTLRMLHSVTL